MNGRQQNHESLEQRVARLRRGTRILVLSTAILVGLIASADAFRLSLFETNHLRARRVELIDATGEIMATIDRDLVLRDAAGRICARLDGAGPQPGLTIHANGRTAVTVTDRSAGGEFSIHSREGAATVALGAPDGGELELASAAGDSLARIGSTNGESRFQLLGRDGQKLVEVAGRGTSVAGRIHAEGSVAVSFGTTDAGTGFLSARNDRNSMATIDAADSKNAGMCLRNAHGTPLLFMTPSFDRVGGHVRLSSSTDDFAGVELDFDRAGNPHAYSGSKDGDLEDYRPRARVARPVARKKAPPPGKSAPQPSMTSGETQCGSCHGSGVKTCSSCGGSGYHTVTTSHVEWDGSVTYGTEQQSCGSCSGGQRSCGSCGGDGRK